jgi:hypothetical protein
MTMQIGCSVRSRAALVVPDASRAESAFGSKLVVSGSGKPFTLCDSDRVVFATVNSGLVRWK